MAAVPDFRGAANIVAVDIAGYGERQLVQNLEWRYQGAVGKQSASES